MSKPVYTIHAERDGVWWSLVVPELRGVYSQAKRLDQARPAIHEVIEGIYDRAPDTYYLDLVIDDAEISGLVQVAKDARRVAELVAQSARDRQAEIVEALRGRGLPLRDVGELLGVSHQRIARLERKVDDSRGATAESLERLLDLLEKALSKSKGRDKVA
jgi:predicted RNase H-like HicB family nuclease